MRACIAGPPDDEISTVDDVNRCYGNASPILATASDNCDPAPTFTCSPTPSDLSLGLNVVTCTADNDVNGNPADGTCTVQITVVDDVAPRIACPGNINVANKIDTCAADISIQTPDTADNCDTNVDVTCTRQTGSDAPVALPFTLQSIPVGVHTVSCVAIDDAGNDGTLHYLVALIVQ
jgi:hypothetical protein